MRHSSERGFTLPEMIVTIAVGTIAMFALTSIIFFLYRANTYTINQSYEVSNARRGLELLVRDLREMTYGDDGAYPLVFANSHEIRFYSDIDRDNSVELVRYYFATTTLYKSVTNAVGTPPTYGSTPDDVDIISRYVRTAAMSTSTFAYFDENGQSVSTSSVTDIRLINVTIIVNVDPNRDPEEFTLQSSAALRNLKTEF